MIVYLAHPLGLPPQGKGSPRTTVRANLKKAKAWLRWAIRTYPDVTFVAPWITTCEVLDDTNLADRAKGFRMNQDVLARCDQVWLVGPRTSNGMKEEGCWMAGWGKPVLSVTYLERDAPPDDHDTLIWMAWTPSDYATHQEAVDAIRRPKKPDQLALPAKGETGPGQP